MLTTVILDGAMGKRFGRKWHLKVNSPADALRLIDANVGGVFHWLKEEVRRLDSYKVVCEYADGRIEQIGQDEYVMEGVVKKIRFTPLVAGSGGNVGKIITGAALIIIGVVISVFSSGLLAQFGAGIAMAGVGMVAGGVIGLLTPTPKYSAADNKGIKSDYFDGPENTSIQGSAIPLIYGDVLVGSQPISVIYDVGKKV